MAWNVPRSVARKTIQPDPVERWYLLVLDPVILKKDDMIKIAGSLTPIGDELIRQIPGPKESGT